MSFTLRRLVTSFALFALAQAQSADQELKQAIASKPSLSLFSSLLDAAPDSLTSALGNRTTNITMLIPTNDAITKYLTESGTSDIKQLKPTEIQTFFSYHALAVKLEHGDFADIRGLTVPTLLQGQEFNNRSAGDEMLQEYGQSATGQVVFIQMKAAGTRKRQDNGPTTGPVVNVRAGLDQDVDMTVVDGLWGADNANTYQTVDQVLAPPRTCSTTIRTINKSGDTNGMLSALDTALNRTQLWPALDTSKNVTCLAPSTQAFVKAGNPQNTLSDNDLTGALLAHTLDQVTYTNFLEDGMVINTLNGTTVRVSVKGSDIFFGNARIIQPNVLTNNGLVHILDAVITEEEPVSSTSTATGTSTGTATTGSSTASTGASTTGTGTASATGTGATTTPSHGAGHSLSVGYPGLVVAMAGLIVL